MKISAVLHLVLSLYRHSDRQTDGQNFDSNTVRCITCSCTVKTNKSAQSNLGRGLCCGAVAQVRRKVPIGYNAAPQIRPKSTASRLPTPKPH